MAKFVAIFTLKISHFCSITLNLCYNIFVYLNNSKYLSRLFVFCSHKLQNICEPTDELHPKTDLRRKYAFLSCLLIYIFRGGWVSVLFIYIVINFFSFSILAATGAAAPICSGTVNAAD